MDEYFEYLGATFDGEFNWFIGAMKLCEEFGLSFDDAVNIIIEYDRREEDGESISVRN